MMRAGRSFSFVAHGRAIAGGSKRAFVVKGRPVVTDDTGAAGRTWRRDVQEAARGARDAGTALLEPLTGPLVVTFRFYVARPKSHYGRGGQVLASAPALPTVRPDVLKLARAVEDALTGIVWRDDAQIVSEHLGKAYGTPRVEATISEVE